MNDAATDPILDYPTKPDGSYIPRGFRGGFPKLPRDAPPPHALGSVHWAAIMIFGNTERFVQLIESIVAGQGQGADPQWIKFCLIYREWQRLKRFSMLSRDPTLNDVAFVLKLNTQDLFNEVATAQISLNAKVAAMKAAEAVPEAIDLTIAAMKDLEKGGKDRELILKIGGVTEDKPGFNVAINNNNQVGIAVAIKNELSLPLAQFRETIEAVDADVREQAVERAMALPPADLTDAIDVEVEKEVVLELVDNDR